jgi:hypothetical protein
VPEEKMDKFVETVNGYPGPYIQNALDEISKKSGVTEILNLPAVQTFKIKVDFEV